MGAGQEQQDFFIDWNTTGLTDVDYRVIDLSDLSILASGTAVEIESTGGEGRKEGAYKYSFTPDANVFYYVQIRSASAGKYWAGLVEVGKGQEATILTLLQNATYGLSALDAEHEDIRQKATAPAWNQDTDSLEALRDFLETIRGADSDTLKTISDQLDTAQNDLDTPAQYKADVSALALETTLTAIKGAGWSTETLKAIYDLITGLTTERGTDNAALAVVCTETRLAHLNADVSSRAPSSEYDTQMGTGERASAAKLEDAMQKATAPAYNQDSDSQEAIRERVDEVHAEVAGLDGAAMRGTDNGALASVATEVRLSELDATNLPADMDIVKADTPYIADQSLPGTPASGSLGQIVKDQLDQAVSTRATPTQVNAEVDQALQDIHLDHYIGITGAVSDTTPAANNFDTNLASTTDDWYKGMILLFTSGALDNLPRRINSYTGATKNVEVENAFPQAPANGDTFVLLGIEALSGTGPTAAQVADAVWEEPQADHEAAGSFGKQIKDIKANVDATIGSRATPAEVDAEVDEAIENYELDHINAVAHPTGKAAWNSLFSLIMEKDSGQNFNRVTDSLEALADAIGAISAGAGHAVGHVVIYIVAEDMATTEGDDDGSNPALTTEVSKTCASEAAAESDPSWSEDIDFEQTGTITVISIFHELHWQMKITGSGTGYAKWQISGDGGTTWIDLCVNVEETGTTYADKKRVHVGTPITSITSGTNKLQFRLCAWTTATSVQTKVRCNSYTRITYRKG